MVIEIPFWDAKTGLGRFMENRKNRGMGFHTAALAALAEWSVKDKFGVAEFSSQSLGASIQLSVEDQAATGAVLDRNDDRVLQSFRHPEPVFGQGDKVGIALDENWNSKFCLEQFAKVDIGTRKDRTPECDTTMRVDESGKTDADATDIADGFTCLFQTSTHTANDQGDQLRRSQRQRFQRDGIGRGDVSDKIGNRKDDLVSRDLDADDVGVGRVQSQHDQRPTTSPAGRAASFIFNERSFID